MRPRSDPGPKDLCPSALFVEHRLRCGRLALLKTGEGDEKFVLEIPSLRDETE